MTTQARSPTASRCRGWVSRKSSAGTTTMGWSTPKVAIDSARPVRLPRLARGLSGCSAMSVSGTICIPPPVAAASGRRSAVTMLVGAAAAVSGASTGLRRTIACTAAPVPRPRLDPAMLTSITYIGSRECRCHDATPVIPWNHPAHTLQCWLVDLDRALTAGTRSQRAAPVPRPRLDPAMLTSITYIGSRECRCHDATPVIPWNHPAHTLQCWLVDLDAALTAGTRSQRAAPVPRLRLDPAMLTSITYIGSRECRCHDATPVIPWNHPAHTLQCWLVDLDAALTAGTRSQRAAPVPRLRLDPAMLTSITYIGSRECR